MAGRKLKVGLDYWPFDVSFFSDIKVRKLIKYQSGNAVTVYAYLLCSIYENGYYMRWDKELPFIISEATGYKEVYIQEVIKCCLNIDLFSQELFDKEQILTSKGIQERFQFISKTCNRKAIISEYNIIPLEEKVISWQEMPINGQSSQQSKVNKRKAKESKVNAEDRFAFQTPYADVERKFATPTLDEVKMNFQQQGKSEAAAISFFNYYEGVGWMKGVTRIQNWRAFALNWSDNTKVPISQIKPKNGKVSHNLDSSAQAEDIIEKMYGPKNH